MLERETVAETMEDADRLLTTVTEDEPEAAAVEPAAPPEGPTRDEQGRFAAPPPAEPEAPAGEGAPAPAPEPGAEPQAETQPEAEVEASYPEFSYRADGQELTIPGSAVGEDGVFIPKQYLPEYQSLLAEGHAARGSVRRRLSEAATQVQAANQQVAAAKAEAQHVLGYIEQLIENGQMPAWLENVSQNWPVLKAEARAKSVEMQNAAERAQLQAYQERERQAQQRPLMQQALHRAVEQFGAEAGLDDRMRSEVEKRLSAYEQQVFVKAPYDVPEAGLRQGELAINFQFIKDWIGMAGLQRPAAVPAAQPPKAVALPPKPGVKPPPTVGRGTATSGRAVPQPKTREEADAMLVDGDLSWAEEG